MKGQENFEKLMDVSILKMHLVAGLLLKQGFTIRVVPSLVSQSPEERWEYTDDGDLEITQIVEVKGWDMDFKTWEEVTYSNIIVNEAYKVLKMDEDPKHISEATKFKYDPRLYGYLTVNKSLSAGIFINGKTFPHWFSRLLPDSKEGGKPKWFCMCPRKYACFIPNLKQVCLSR